MMKIKEKINLRVNKKKRKNKMKKQEQMKLELNSLLIASKHLIDQFLTLEAIKDSPDYAKTDAQKVLWKCLNLLGEAEIKLENELSKEND